MSDVPEGYKMSEVGVIPEDWEVKTFGDVMTSFSSGATPYRGRPEYYKGNIRWITSGELNYNVITDTIEKITENAVRNTNLKVHPNGTFLMAITGLEAEGTRGSCGIVGAEATTNQSCMALFPTKELLTEYLFHYYVNYGNSLALEYCQGTKQQSYTAKIVKILPIIVPPTIEEQQAIASVLNDVDALITALEQLITKKRNIKQGAMQQLLAGKKRLPGFEGAWEVKTLENVCAKNGLVRGPFGGTLKKEFFVRNGLKVYEQKNAIYRNVDLGNYFIDKNKFNELKRFEVKKGDFIVSCSGTIGKIYQIPKGAECGIINQALLKIKTEDNIIHDRFFFYYFDWEKFQEKIIDNTQGGAMQNLVGMNIFRNTQILLPPLSEQQAIAKILSDMDTEIESLEQKRDKYKAIKQGMMQELLTGKRRLA